MKYERIVALSSGTCIKIDNSLNSSVKSITFELENNKKYEDHISIFNVREMTIDGTAYSDNNRVVIKNQVINDRAFDLQFNIDTTDLHSGDVIEGSISVISNVGAINIPFTYNIIDNNVNNVINTFNTITDYYDYLSSNFNTGKSIFTKNEILKAPFMQDPFKMSLYTSLIKGSNENIAMIEFFKAFQLDISKFFVDINDEMTQRYLDNTMEYIDLSNVTSDEKYESIYKAKNEIENKKINDEVFNEATELIYNLRDRELFNAFASYCVRSGNTDEISFYIYLKVIENGSNINGIYDKFLLSIPEEYENRLPIYIYKLYYEDKSYSFENKLKLYENIIKTFDTDDEVYKYYSEEIREYVLSCIYQNKITESLIKIYSSVLCKEIINKNNCNNVLYLLRNHKVVVNNKNIRRIIIKYIESEKETKYDVINQIAYVPIFFDSYIMIYEDQYNNRYYSEEVSIRVLFDRKDLENYIIETFPSKDILDMTKVIKLNELEKFTNEYEIEEVKNLQTSINVNSVIKERFKSKIINYYFESSMNGNAMEDSVISFLKNMPFSNLTLYDKRKLLKVLLDAHEYKFVYGRISRFGLSLMEDNDLVLLFSNCIDINDEEDRTKLINDILSFTKKRKKDPKLLTYISNNFEGSIENLDYILKSLIEFKLDTYYVAKKLLMLSLECNRSEYIDFAYQNFDKNDSSEMNLKIAYFNKKATDYMLDDKKTEEQYFNELTRYILENFDEIDTMPIIFILAITKYISTIQLLTNNDLRRILVKTIDRLLKLDLVFAFYKKLNKHIQMPYYIMNKEYIEYHADKDFVPKAVLSFSGTDEKKEVELSKVFMNIYVKRITVFKNEIINYEILNSNDETQGILAKGTLTFDENYEFEYPRHGKMKTTFDFINDAIVCLDRDNIEGLKKVVLDMSEKQQMSKRLFNLNDFRSKS